MLVFLHIWDNYVIIIYMCVKGKELIEKYGEFEEFQPYDD